MSNKIFKGIMPALITPFNGDGSIKRDAVKEIIDYEYSCGVNGFYINGSTGEGPALSLKSRIEMSEAVVEYNNNRGVIIEHIGAPDFLDAEELVKHAERVGVTAISSLAPNFYFSFSDNEIIDYYKRISSLTSKPVVAYVTGMLKTDIVSLVERMMQIDNVVGVKYTIPDYFLMRKLCEVNNGDINIINGPDEMLICGLIMGADGGIGSTYNVMPDWYVKLYEAASKGNWDEAKQWQYKINKVISLILRVSENGAVKGVKLALRARGFDAGDAVYPSRKYSDSELAAMKAELIKLGIEL